MAVSAIGNSLAAYVQKATASTSGGAMSAALMEASETPDVTRKEAANGDPVAIRRLAREQAPTAPAPTPPPQASTGSTVDVQV